MFPNWYRCFQVDNVSKLCFQINYYLLFWSINGPWFSDQPLFQPFVPVRYRGTTGETLKVACRPCYERFRAKQAGKDVCQFCWRCIEREERHLKIRYKVIQISIGRFQTLFRWILKDSRISTGHVTLFFISESVFIANLMIKSKFRNPNFLESIGIKFETNHWTQHIV